jgi:UDP-glucose-4-epimerase GalE
MGDRVLVTGGAGYVGAEVGRRLETAGYEVIAWDDLSSGWEAAAPGVLVVGDVRNRVDLARALRRGFSAVVHCAGRADVARSNGDPIGTWDVNVSGTISLLAAMSDAGCDRLLFASSAAIYGDLPDLPATEDGPRNPQSHYARTVVTAEEVIAAAPVRAINLRIANVAGASADGWLGDSPGSGLIPRAIAAARGASPVPVHGIDHGTPDGTALRDYVHVEDVADGVALALDALLSGRHTGTFNLGSGRATSVRHVLGRVQALLGAPVPALNGPRRPGDPSALAVSIDRAAAELGFHPTRSLDDAIRHAAAWYDRPRYGISEGAR